ncbi:unnamed protein product [Bursaphelenchus xylophilus]|uniref:(pine wood nematode) hypothetical protein n=1 Tax=Bursaphelenchus xylophilus TaxID=6326 RepID=A0A1I7S145_BURXY|nr:unnamed protein product [Bursaphelenchus xylophilus]CAG9079958.1 unnamed protein product [Bursaphelenchus xylophilus]
MNLFTVEQLELVRRLRSSGVTADNIAEAFRAMEKMETEVPANPDQNPPVSAADFAAFVATSTSTPTFNPAQASSIPNSVLVRQLQQLAEQQQQSTSAITSSAENLQRCAFTTVPESCVFGSSMHSQSSPTLPRPQPSAARPIRSQRQPMKDITTLEDPNELEQFMAQGEEACISDMKKFITQYSLRQTTVAQMTGVSQPYISKLLNGNHRELSLRCRRNIYAWYLNCRRHPAMYCQDPTTRLETNGDGELVPQRRERYVFRPVLIRMLEQFFAESPFPDGNKRAEIAQACNTALQAEKRVILGGQLMPKEVVTPQVIANWFANKRKEMRRKSNEENRNRQFLNPSALETPSSPEGSTSSFVESPSSNLLPPLQFGVPLAFLTQQQQPQPQPPPQGISIENLLALNNLSNPLTELLQRSVQLQQLNRNDSATISSTEKVDEQMPVLSAINDETHASEDGSTPSSRSSPQAPNSTESLKSGDESMSNKNQFDLMEKMFGASMMSLMQQLKPNPLPSVE